MLTITHVVNKAMPPQRDSGGVNRFVEWLAQAQHARGYRVHVISPSGTPMPYAGHVALPATATRAEFATALPDDTDLVHHHGGYAVFDFDADQIGKPVLQTVHGNLSDADRLRLDRGQFPRAVFVSRSHMELHNGNRYVLNGIPVGDYVYRDHKDDYLLFLAKVRRSKKGVDAAIRIATGMRRKLVVASGWRLRNLSTWIPVSPWVQSVGRVEGARKYELLAGACALLAPIQWDEPFGLTVVEALASGTPVIAARRGAMAEIIEHGRTGFICATPAEFREAVMQITTLSPADCRHSATERFTIERVVEDYAALYADVISGATW